MKSPSDVVVDVAILGGGIAGLWLLHRLQLEGYSAALFEAEQLGALPVERPTKFELYVNLKTAKELGLTIPPEILIRATKVIK